MVLLVIGTGRGIRVACSQSTPEAQPCFESGRSMQHYGNVIRAITARAVVIEKIVLAETNRISFAVCRN